jgi:hypothetical protein
MRSVENEAAQDRRPVKEEVVFKIMGQGSEAIIDGALKALTGQGSVGSAQSNKTPQPTQGSDVTSLKAHLADAYFTSYQGENAETGPLQEYRSPAAKGPQTAAKKETILTTTKTTVAKTADTNGSSSETRDSTPAPPPVVAAFISPAFVGGAGNAIWISSLNNPVFTLVYAGLATLSYFNELFKDSGGIASYIQKAINRDDQQRPASGFFGWVRERIALPGVCLEANALALVATGLFAAVSGDPVTTVVCGIFAVGDLGGARISNLGVQRPDREKWWPEPILSSLWSMLPKRIQSYLQNPGALFPVGNIPLYTSSLLLIGSSSSTGFALHHPLVVGGAICTTTAAIAGAAQLFTHRLGDFNYPAMIANALGNFMFGSAIILGALTASASTPPISSLLVGISAILWGLSNQRMADEARKDHLDEINQAIKEAAKKVETDLRSQRGKTGNFFSQEENSNSEGVIYIAPPARDKQEA